MYGHIYTDEEHAFMKSYVPGHSYAEIQKSFIEKFGWDISMTQIQSYIGNHKLSTGRNGRFQKGHVSHNKGQKMPPEVYEKAKATMFKKGNVPINHRPVGSERINVDGYVEVKVAEPSKWRLKHNVVWEEHNGPIQKGNIIIFLDGNPMNLDINNLKCITRAEHLCMNRYNLRFTDPESTLTATNIAKLQCKIAERKTKNGKNTYKI